MADMRRVLTAGLAAGAALASLRALARPLPVTDQRLLDWEQVRRIAHGRGGETGPRLREADAAALGRRYDAMAAELAPLIAQVVQEPFEGYPPFTVLDRRDFVDRNLVIVQRLFEPVERLRARLPESRATALSRGMLSRYVGELFGFLSQRVLGQYDPVLMLAPPTADTPAPALFLVEPNVERFQQRSESPGETLRRWLVLHELTHAWQFEAHPWLREHIGGIMQQLLLDQLVRQLEQREQAGASAVALVRGLPSAVTGQLRAMQRIQAVMSVCEGYSNFVMHEVGSRHLADFERLERAFHERSANRTALERIVLAVTGMNMKMRQYELGEAFARGVRDRAGLRLLNRVWEGPDLMPTMSELQHPERWIARVS